MMSESIIFSIINVGSGACVSWLISHYLLPIIFDVDKNYKRSTYITAIYTVAALIRNVIVYEIFNA